MNNQFEDWLRAVHGKQFSGTEDQKDNDFEVWLGGLGNDEIIGYADEWGQELLAAYRNQS